MEWFWKKKMLPNKMKLSSLSQFVSKLMCGHTQKMLVDNHRIEESQEDLKTDSINPTFPPREDCIQDAKSPESGKLINTHKEDLKVVKHRTSRGFNRTDHIIIGKEGKTYSINGKKSGFTIEDLIKDAMNKLDKGEAQTSVTLEFKSICEDECMAIVEELGSVRLKNLSKNPCRALDATVITTEDLGNGMVRIKIPLKTVNNIKNNL